MCGLYAVYGFEGDESNIENIMKNSLASRGPDSFFLNKPSNGIFLGQSILSFSRKQKKHDDNEHESPSGRYITLLNGEIYNWVEIARKYKLDCISDINLIAKLIDIEKIENIISQLSGMYIIIILDKNSRTINVIRDPIGEKNAFFYFNNGKLLISSILEPIVKSIKEIKLNTGYIKSYFCTRHLLSKDTTIYENVYRFDPGCLTIFSLEEKKIEKIEIKRISSWVDKNYHNYLNKLEIADFKKLLESELSSAGENIQNNSRGIATICSGGIDSSLATFYSKLSNQNIKSFALSFAGKDIQANEFNEKQNLINVDILNVTPSMYLDNLIECYSVVCGPLPTHSFPSQLLISKYAKSNGSVSLITGDGGDELLGGYSAYTNAKFENNKPSIYSEYNKNNITDANLKDDIEFELGSKWRESLDIYNFLNNEDRYLQAMLFMDSGIQLASTALLSSDLLTSSIGMESRGFYLQEKIIRLALNMPIKYKLKKENNGYVTRPIMKQIYKDKFNFNIQSKQGFSGYPEIGKLFLEKNFDNPYKETVEILGINGEINEHMGRDILWKITNVALFLNLKNH